MFDDAWYCNRLTCGASRLSAPSFVSAGRLPTTSEVAELVARAHARFEAVDEGECSTVYPALANADLAHFGIGVVDTHGQQWHAGDSDATFTIMSIAKPFVLALVCEAIGHDDVRRLVGVDATGLPFNSIAAVEGSGGGLTNPMVNAGAIVTSSLVPGADIDERWEFLVEGLSAMAGRRLELDLEVYTSAIESNHRNRALAHLLFSLGRLHADPDDTVELYTRQSALSVDVLTLATLGATLANGGTNPLTGKSTVRPFVCHDVMSAMATAGMYEKSGQWLWDVGLPGKSGISGAIITASPGKGGLGVYSPPLDSAGNSVRGQLTAKYLSTRLGLDLFATQPATAAPHQSTTTGP